MRRLVAALLLLVGIVLSRLRTAAAAIPTLIANDVVVGPTAATMLGGKNAVRPEAEQARISAYDARLRYDEPSRLFLPAAQEPSMRTTAPSNSSSGVGWAMG